MDAERLDLLLQALPLQTLAHIVVDLHDIQYDWEYYPEEAPREPVRQALEQILTQVKDLGTERAGSEELDFMQLVEWIKKQRQDEDWSWERDVQEHQNWLKDYE